MKPTNILAALLAGAGVTLSGCEKGKNATGELEKAAAALAEPAQAQSEPAPAAAPVNLPPAQQVQQALVDYKAGRMEDAVTRLQVLRSAAVLSPEQRMALQDSIAAVMAEVYALAEKGDPRAVAAVAQYERMQTSH